MFNCSMNTRDLKRLNKIAIQDKTPRWKVCKEAIGLEILVNVVLSIFTLLECIQYADNVFHSLIILCENDYFHSSRYVTVSKDHAFNASTNIVDESTQTFN